MSDLFVVWDCMVWSNSLQRQQKCRIEMPYGVRSASVATAYVRRVVGGDWIASRDYMQEVDRVQYV